MWDVPVGCAVRNGPPPTGYGVILCSTYCLVATYFTVIAICLTHLESLSRLSSQGQWPHRLVYPKVEGKLCVFTGAVCAVSRQVAGRCGFSACLRHDRCGPEVPSGGVVVIMPATLNGGIIRRRRRATLTVKIQNPNTKKPQKSGAITRGHHGGRGGREEGTGERPRDSAEANAEVGNTGSASLGAPAAMGVDAGLCDLLGVLALMPLVTLEDEQFSEFKRSLVHEMDEGIEQDGECAPGAPLGSAHCG